MFAHTANINLLASRYPSHTQKPHTSLNSLLGILGLMLFSVMGLILPKPLEVFLAAILAAVSLLVSGLPRRVRVPSLMCACLLVGLFVCLQLLVWWVRENPEFFSSESMPLSTCPSRCFEECCLPLLGH